MGQQIQLNTSRMQCIGAYLAKPQGTPKGGIVVVQEIFGVNGHMRSVADQRQPFDVAEMLRVELDVLP